MVVETTGAAAAVAALFEGDGICLAEGFKDKVQRFTLTLTVITTDTLITQNCEVCSSSQVEMTCIKGIT
jgi:hypothetical protein